jgi:hypothetical protein
MVAGKSPSDCWSLTNNHIISYIVSVKGNTIEKQL